MEGFGVVGCESVGSGMTEADLLGRSSVRAFYSGPG
jgi:hypothetical protein